MDIAVAEFSADDCKMLGFNKANVLCSTCKHFAESDLEKIQYVKIYSIKNYQSPEYKCISFFISSTTCKECCLKDNDYELSGSKRYPKAILEVCTCKFGQYPQIQGILQSTSDKSNIIFNFKFNINPYLLHFFQLSSKATDQKSIRIST